MTNKSPVTFLALFGRYAVMGDVNMVVTLHDMFTKKLMLTELYFETQFWKQTITGIVRAVEGEAATLVKSNIPFVASAAAACCDEWNAWEWDFETFTGGDIGNLKVNISIASGTVAKPKEDKTEEIELQEFINSFDQISEASELLHIPPPYLRAWEYQETDISRSLQHDYNDPVWAEDYFSRLKTDAPKFKWLFIGPKGVRTPLHVDPCLTHAWMGQVRGSKLWKLVPPSSLQYLVDDNGFADLSDVDVDRFPDHDKAIVIETVVNPGEIIFVPQGWAHDVTTLQHGIAITHNFLSKEGFTKVVRQACLSKLLTSKPKSESAA